MPLDVPKVAIDVGVKSGTAQVENGEKVTWLQVLNL